MQRFSNLITALAMLIILSPVFIVVSIAVKLTSKGPVLFKQRRIGKDNKEFILYKFRTMRTDTPNVATHLLKNASAFITPIGKFLRKSSFDELPQLLNIIKGDMYFIGPRPALYNQYDLIEMRTKVGVHKVRPGLSGWAQINGRDVLDNESKVKADEYYLKNQSLILDIKIAFFTVFRVLKAEGVVDGEVKDKTMLENNNVIG